MADAVILHLPIPTLGIIGWEADASISGSVAWALPVPVLSTGSIVGMQLTLPVPVLAIAGSTGFATNAYQQPLVLPRLSLAIAGRAGVIGGIQFTLPLPRVQALDPDLTALALPIPTLRLVGETGAVGSVVGRLPAPVLSVVGSVQFVAATALSIRPTLSVAGVTGAGGSVGMALRALQLAASGYTGNIGNVVMALPVMRLSAAGGEQMVGTVNLALPILMLQATGITAGAGGSVAYALHLEAQALTTYANFNFNSMTQFNGVYLGATDAGIFALAGANDAGVAIDAVVRVGISDFGTSKLKRIDRAYVGYSTDGDMELRVVTEGAPTRRYALLATGATGIHGNHVRIGKGVQTRYWQFEIANVNGADFELNCLEVKPSRLGRRVGGGDA